MIESHLEVIHDSGTGQDYVTSAKDNALTNAMKFVGKPVVYWCAIDSSLLGLQAWPDSESNEFCILLNQNHPRLNQLKSSENIDALIDHCLWIISLADGEIEVAGDFLARYEDQDWLDTARLDTALTDAVGLEVYWCNYVIFNEQDADSDGDLRVCTERPQDDRVITLNRNNPRLTRYRNENNHDALVEVCRRIKRNGDTGTFVF